MLLLLQHEVVAKMSDRQEKILEQIADERFSQLKKWGAQAHPDGTYNDFQDKISEARDTCEYERYNLVKGPSWRAILYEEVMESFGETDKAKLRAELIQVAAVAVAWIEDLDSRKDEP